MLAADRLCYDTAKHQVSICVPYTRFWHFQLSHKISDPQTGFDCLYFGFGTSRPQCI